MGEERDDSMKTHSLVDQGLVIAKKFYEVGQELAPDLGLFKHGDDAIKWEDLRMDVRQHLTLVFVKLLEQEVIKVDG